MTYSRQGFSADLGPRYRLSRAGVEFGNTSLDLACPFVRKWSVGVSRHGVPQCIDQPESVLIRQLPRRGKHSIKITHGLVSLEF